MLWGQGVGQRENCRLAVPLCYKNHTEEKSFNPDGWRLNPNRGRWEEGRKVKLGSEGSKGPLCPLCCPVTGSGNVNHDLDNSNENVT